MSKLVDMETLVALAKRRGFVFQSSEIYGGLAGFWDLGPYGMEMAKNIKDVWWRDFVYKQANIVGLDTTIIQNSALWRASGHVDTFVDPMVDCKNCKHRFRADELAGFETRDLAKYNIELAKLACPNCGKVGAFTPVKQFEMMFKTSVGPTEDASAITYLRPETAEESLLSSKMFLKPPDKNYPLELLRLARLFVTKLHRKTFCSGCVNLIKWN